MIFRNLLYLLLCGINEMDKIIFLIFQQKKEKLTAPVCIKISVQVNSDAVCAPVEGTVLPPQPVLTFKSNKLLIL